eukprot:1276728-Amphidinium_carterae.1
MASATSFHETPNDTPASLAQGLSVLVERGWGGASNIVSIRGIPSDNQYTIELTTSCVLGKRHDLETQMAENDFTAALLKEQAWFFCT